MTIRTRSPIPPSASSSAETHYSSSEKNDSRDEYAQTGPNRVLAYWVRTPAFGSAIQQCDNQPHFNAAIPQPKFEYVSALRLDVPEIRLLCLLPRDPSATRVGQSPVRCELRHVLLSDNPVFLALSYVWGSQQVTKRITVNDGYMDVTVNPAHALQHLQLQSATLALWVDAICINQGSTGEKNCQASLVLGWLGPAADDSDEAMSILDWLGKETMIRVRNNGANPKHEAILPDLLSKHHWPHEKVHQAVRSVGALFKREWWTRVWILQEVELAKDVLMICGELGIPLDVLRMGFEAVNDFAVRTRDGRPLADMAKAIRRDVSSGPPRILGSTSPKALHVPARSDGLAFWISRSNNLAATNLKDYVYALLALAGDVDELGICVDYNKSVVEIFTDVATRLLEKQQALFILSWCQRWPDILTTQYEPCGLPSWVPDFSFPIPSGALFGSWNATRWLYSATGTTHTRCTASRQMQLSISDGVLKIDGAEFDTVQCAGPRPSQRGPESGKKFDATARVKEAIELVAGHRARYSTSGAFHDAVWRTVIADAEFDFVAPKRATPRLQAGYEAMSARWKPPGPPVPSEELRALRSRLMEPYCLAISCYCTDRRIFITTGGYLGIGPRTLEEGDTVCILFGAPAPFLVRKVACSDSYQLIGECYLHGIMDGEFFDTDPPGMEFSIR
ncbi:heterokaryon incompatibility protein-domain-containing protein [Lasiosphaeria ovina]|uniref:Heterokaryon incompatibility protein-domain-containing protein n=1 Tax=Lasiosphaeria ovina TaxID=92902 RepID=A0AAE0K2L8_9PEZI|nr:heterokaryon incompatibility protein-domain-containing protein [Lasiosphaeria ovina]